MPVKICIAGAIAAGKTTLAHGLSKKLAFRVCEEPSAENEYLSDFYEDKAAHAFACQVAFLSARFKQHSNVMQSLKAGEGVVTARGPFEDVIFARMLHDLGEIDDRDFRTYISLFDMLIENVGADVPDLILLLDVDIEELMRRVQKRGRTYEKDGGVDRNYLQQLIKQYTRFANEMAQRTTVIRVDWNTFHTTDALWDAVEQVYDSKPGIVKLVLGETLL